EPAAEARAFEPQLVHEHVEERRIRARAHRYVTSVHLNVEISHGAASLVAPRLRKGATCCRLECVEATPDEGLEQADCGRFTRSTGCQRRWRSLPRCDNFALHDKN